MKKKKESTTSNKIADSLREEINFGRLKPSDKIIEREIAEKYKASHIPVREALRILEGEGFVIHRKFAGYTVREVNPEEMIELYNIMRFLCVQLLTRAIPRYTEITYYQLKSITAEMEKTTDAEKSIDLLMQFAEVIFFPAGLNYTFNLAKQFLKRNIPVLQGVITKPYKGTIPVTHFNHFIELCQKHEIENAVKFTTEQYDKVTKMFVAYMSELRKAS
ncbi:MAG: GntR family transcriptional regulator [Bacteroidetes bacterium]|nr:GntR family transcriptional regulator [Bacteroidota bacterium]